MGDAAQILADRQAAADVVTAYAMALDARDWVGFRSLFEDVIRIDYSSLGSISADMPADDWVARCRVLGAFDATQHKVSNLTCTLDSDHCQVVSYVDAAHFMTRGGVTYDAFALGTYVHVLDRAPGGWKIAACTFRLAGHPGGRARFDQAFALARQAFAAGNDQ